MSFDGPNFIHHVAQRLIHEFQFSGGAGTPGLVGAAKEHPARVQLERLMPGGVGIGSGLIVDSYGSVSRQQDIVIYESLCPVFTHNDAPEATYYPVEGVIAAGEVKGGLSKTELLDAVSKSVSVKVLRRRSEATDHQLGWEGVSYRHYGSPTSFAAAPEEQFDQDQKSMDQIFTFVLCERLLSSPQKTLENFVQACRNAGAPLAPNLVTSLNDGTIYPHNSLSGSITRAMMEGDGAIFVRDPIGGFAELIRRLRLYATAGRTVERNHFERYFRSLSATDTQFEISAHVTC